MAVFLLPHTRVSNVISIPVKPTFYYYTLTLFFNCLALTIGCTIVLSRFSFSQCGYCLINLAHYLYFSYFIPLVYLIFFNDFFYHPVKIPFSYTMNESMYDDNPNSIDSTNTYLEEDNNSFMHQPSGSGCTSDPGIANAAVLASGSGHPNNFILNGPVYGKGAGRSQDQINYHRFLYNTHIQSPGTGYSSVEESTTATVSAHGSMEFIQQQQQQQQSGHPNDDVEETDTT